jgi:hypothetical protein
MSMFWIIFSVIFGVSFLAFIFLWMVLIGVSKAAEEAHKDGWDNPFE